MKLLEHLGTTTQEKVLALIADATKQDGAPPVAEHVLLHLRYGGDKAARHLIMESGEEVIGYAHIDLTDEIDGPSAELVIHPKHRNQKLGSQLLAEVTKIAGDRLRLWSHGDSINAQKMAENRGFKRVRTVIQMRRSLNDPIADINNSIEIRNFLNGIDNDEWIALNNRIFNDHPEQSSWSNRDLDIRIREDWFDDKGFLVATENGKMVAFCWTKIHGGNSHKHANHEETHAHDPIGEIYIMGVHPDYSGRGFGGAITIAGLQHMRYQGIFSAMLYVESQNESALKLYRKLGFTEWGRDVLYKISGS